MKRIIVLTLVILIFILNAPAVQAGSASLSVGLSGQSVTVGDSVTVTVYVNSGGQAINSAEGTLNFDGAYLEGQSCSISGSIFSMWTPAPNLGGGTVTFGGGLPSPGYSGSDGKIFSCTFKANKSGTTSLNISGGRVLANDGQGTDVFGGAGGATLSVNEGSSGGSDSGGETGESSIPGKAAPTISSSSHPDQNKWYKEKTVRLSWTRPGGSQGVSYEWDRNQGTGVDDRLEGSETSEEYKVSDGVYWFHAKAKYDDGFSSQANFKVRVDSVAPEPFTVSVEQEGGLTNAKPKLKFEAKDVTSGIDRYEVKIDNGKFASSSSPLTLDTQVPGRHTATVKALDKAGNATEAVAEFRVQGLPAPKLGLPTKTLAVFQELKLHFSAPEDWTIVVYIDDTETARLSVREQKRVVSNFRVYGADQEKLVEREFVYREVLKPGRHSAYIVGTDPQGNLSEPSERVYFTVLASAVQIAGRAFSTWLVLVVMLALFGIMSTVVILMVVKTRRQLRKWLSNYRAKAKVAADKIEREMEGVEERMKKELPAEEAKKVAREIEKTKKDIKKDLKPLE